MSRQFVDYLDKENRFGNPGGFFDSSRNDIDSESVVQGIDSNCRKLSYDETRFYSLTLNPSKWELKAIEEQAKERTLQVLQASSDPLGLESERAKNIKAEIMRDVLQEYARRAMDEYARNFGREGIESGADLVWFGRVEENRYWKNSYYSVRHNEKTFRKIAKAEKAGDMKLVEQLRDSLYLESSFREDGKPVPVREWLPKSGMHHHIHILVSRRDKLQRYKLSPEAKARSNSQHVVGGKKCRVGFDRNRFNLRCEQTFDELVGYRRHFHEMYESRKLLEKDPAEYVLKRKEFYREFYREEIQRRREEWMRMHRQGKSVSGQDLSNYPLYPLYPIRRITYEAGARIIQERLQPFRDVATGIMAGVRLSRKGEISRKEALRAMRSALTSYASAAGMDSLASVVTPAIAAINVGRGIVSALSSKDRSMER